jgi:hypothetical protein
MTQPGRVWLKAFWGFDPSEEGYLGFTKEWARTRLIENWRDGDLVLIYGADNRETAKEDRRQALGFLEIEPIEITDTDRSSVLAQQRKIDHGWQNRWTFSVPVRRAWEVGRRIEISNIARETYNSRTARAIASQGMLLSPAEAQRALALPVRQISVFGEPPIDLSKAEEEMLKSFTPSRGIEPTFGKRESEYEDGDTYLYMYYFSGDVPAFLGRDRFSINSKILVKVGYSNNLKRRNSELNCGFPPAMMIGWKLLLQSRAFESAKDAKAAEDQLKAELDRRFESLGGEFFLGDQLAMETVFISAASVTAFKIPGAPRQAAKR